MQYVEDKGICATDSSIKEKIEYFVEFLLDKYPDPELYDLLKNTVLALRTAYERGLSHWVITYSGGKDSSTVLVLALEVLKHSQILGWGPESVDVIFSDTLLELPPVLAQVEILLSYVEQVTRDYSLPIKIHKVVPKIDRRFWYNILAKGYPPPHNRFRWCTDRLKIEPSEAIIKEITMNGPAVLLTGVRYDESDARTGRLNAACSQGGECGQGVWFKRSERLNTNYLAPIAEWRTCKVWDFLTWVAPIHEWPTSSLAALYGSEPIRFGCWTCPLVKKDKATETIVQRDGWTHLKPLQDMRTLLISVGRSMNPDDRLLRPDGHVGKISLERRQQLFRELKVLEQEIGITLLNPEEATAIEAYWTSTECLSLITISDQIKARKSVEAIQPSDTVLNYLDV